MHFYCCWWWWFWGVVWKFHCLQIQLFSGQYQNHHHEEIFAECSLPPSVQRVSTTVFREDYDTLFVAFHALQVFYFFWLCKLREDNFEREAC